MNADQNTSGQQDKKYDDCSENGNDGGKPGTPSKASREATEQGPYRTNDEQASGDKAYETQDPAPHNETDSGQGAPGIQGQYPGSNDQHLYPKPGTAPDRPDTDGMNREGSSQVALGSRKSDSDKRREE